MSNAINTDDRQTPDNFNQTKGGFNCNDQQTVRFRTVNFRDLYPQATYYRTKYMVYSLQSILFGLNKDKYSTQVLYI